jgi:DNA-binding response OmpR family regulator
MKILLVENDADTARAMSILLKRSGHAVTVAESIATARQTAKTTPVELLICDLGLPDGNGRQLLAQLRESHDIRGICVSGQTMGDEARESEAAGFEAHLAKPIDMHKLETLIAQLATRPPDARLRRRLPEASTLQNT